MSSAYAQRKGHQERLTASSLAATFTELVKSFVNNILMPPISIIFPLNKNMDQKFAILKKGQSYNESAQYNTPQQARDDGAVIMAYG